MTAPLAVKPMIAIVAETSPVDPGRLRSGTIAALFTFFALTFGFSWGFAWISFLVKPAAPVLSDVVYTLCGFGPSLAAPVTVLMWDGRVGLGRWVRRCLNWHLDFRWFVLAFLAPPLVMLAALGIHAAMGGAVPSSPATGRLDLVVTTFALILLIGGPLSEEFGWRGYALPALAGLYGWRWASLIIGGVWGIWHAPLFFIAGAPQAEMPPLLFLTGTLAMSVAFSRLALNTAFSVLPAIVLHWSINAWAWAIPVTPQGGTLKPYLLVIGLLSLVAVVILLKPGPRPWTGWTRA